MWLTHVWWKIFLIGRCWVFTEHIDRYLSSTKRAHGDELTWLIHPANCGMPVHAQLWLKTSHLPIAHHSSLVVHFFGEIFSFETEFCKMHTLRRRCVGPKSKPFVRSIYMRRTPCALLLVAVRSARGLVPFSNKQNVPRLSHSYLVIILHIKW